MMLVESPEAVVAVSGLYTFIGLLLRHFNRWVSAFERKKSATHRGISCCISSKVMIYC